MPTRFPSHWPARRRDVGAGWVRLPDDVPALFVARGAAGLLRGVWPLGAARRLVVSVAVMAALPAPATAAEDAQSAGGGGVGSSVAMASLLGRVAAQSPAAREATFAAGNDGTGVASPAAPVADAQGHVHDELSRVTVSKWLGRGRASLGLGLGAVGYRPLPGQAAAPAAGLMNPAPAVTVGVRVDVAPRTTMYADASGTAVWNTANDPNAQGALYNTRVGMEFKSAGAARGLGFDRGAIGMQLDSGYRLQMKPRRGGLAVYLRGQF